MKKNKISSFIYLLIIILVLDVILLYYYNSKGEINFSALKKSLFFLKKDFTSNNISYSSLKNGELKINHGSADTPTYTLALFKGKVNGSVYFKKDVESFVVPILITINGNKVRSNLVLGLNDQKISIIFAKKGYINVTEEWSTYKIQDTIRRLKKGAPLIIEVYYQKDVAPFEKISTCDKYCKSKLAELKKYSINTEKIFNNINNKAFTNDLYIGPTASLIIYE